MVAALLAGCSLAGILISSKLSTESSEAPSPASVTAPAEGNTSPTTSLPTSTPRPQTPKAGQAAFNFVLEDLNGNQVALDDLKGKKVVLNFWATWCPPCRAEVPVLVEAYPDLQAENVEILAVNLGEDKDQVAAFAESYGMTFPILLDPYGETAMDYFIQSIPISLFIDSEGIIQKIHVGMLTDTTLRQQIARMDQDQ